ncbi:MAG: CDP-diacylglycerol--glycerol-3-phosphate 3-phosphatidyltransferase [Nitrospirota bacterium]
MGLDASPLEETTLNIFNIPNLLSISRIVAVPIFIVLMLEPSPARALLAGIVFSLASATDWLDGHLARKWGQVTRTGKLLDPIADKILIMSALVTLVEIRSDVVHAWIAIVIIGREFAVTGLRAIASSENIIIPAETVGKYKVGAQITAVLALLLDYYMTNEWLRDLGSLALWVAMILAVYSAIQYFRIFWKKLS